MLEVNNLNCEIDDKKILKNIDFKLNKWEVFWLIWHNWSGKTTLLKSIMWLIPSNGKIIFNNINLNTKKIEERSKFWIWYIMQEIPEYLGITTLMYIKAILKNDFDEKILEEYFDLFWLNWGKYKNRNMDWHLSWWEKKKIEIITTFLMNKDIYLLDEVETALDATSRWILIDIIKQKQKKWTSFIIVSHNQDLINISNNGILLCNGKIQEAGKISKLNSIYLWKCEDCNLHNNCEK